MAAPTIGGVFVEVLLGVFWGAGVMEAVGAVGGGVGVGETQADKMRVTITAALNNPKFFIVISFY